MELKVPNFNCWIRWNRRNKIILEDREVRTQIEKRVEELHKQVYKLSFSPTGKTNNTLLQWPILFLYNIPQNGELSFSKELKNLEKTNIAVKLLIKEVNILNNARMHWANNICHGIYIPKEQSYETTPRKQETSQVRII